MKTREQHLEAHIERMEMSREQYSKELNIVAGLVKERDKLFQLNLEITREWSTKVTELRAELERVSKAAAEMRSILELLRAAWAKGSIASIPPERIFDALSSDAGKDYVKLQSPPEHPASTSGNAAPAEAGPAPCVSDPPAYGISDTPQASLTAAHETGACTSYDALRSIAERIGISRSTLRSVLSPPDASSATPPTGGRQYNGGASQA